MIPYARLAAGVSNVVVGLDPDDAMLYCQRCRIYRGMTFWTTLVETMARHIGQHAVGFDDVPDDLVPGLRATFPTGQIPQEDSPHGAFALCRGECGKCGIAAAEAEALWRQRVAAMGIELVDVATLSPEDRAAYDEQESDAALRAEMDSDADPDPYYGVDLDDD